MERSRSVTSQYECVLVGGSTTAFQHQPSSLSAFAASGGYWTAHVAVPRLGDMVVVVKGTTITKGNRALVELLADTVVHVGYISATTTSVMCHLSLLDLVEMNKPSELLFRVYEIPICATLIAAENLLDGYFACLKSEFLKEYELYLRDIGVINDRENMDADQTDYNAANRPMDVIDQSSLTVEEIENWILHNRGRVKAGADTVENEESTRVTAPIPSPSPSSNENGALQDFAALAHCRMPWHQQAALKRNDELGSLVYSMEGIRGLRLDSDKSTLQENIDQLAASRHGINSLRI